jgi:hypothetical protein
MRLACTTYKIVSSQWSECLSLLLSFLTVNPVRFVIDLDDITLCIERRMLMQGVVNLADDVALNISWALLWLLSCFTPILTKGSYIPICSMEEEEEEEEEGLFTLRHLSSGLNCCVRRGCGKVASTPPRVRAALIVSTCSSLIDDDWFVTVFNGFIGGSV